MIAGLVEALHGPAHRCLERADAAAGGAQAGPAQPQPGRGLLRHPGAQSDQARYTLQLIQNSYSGDHSSVSA